MQGWFHGPSIACLHTIVAGGNARWAAIVLPMEQAYSATALMCLRATFDKSPLSPALQVFFCVPLQRVFKVNDTPYFVQRSISSSSSSAVSGCSASQFALS